MGMETEKDPIDALPEYPLELILEELWARGDLDYLVRDGQQRLLWDSLKRWTDEGRSYGPHVVNTHRKWGKSFILALFCWARCLRSPNQLCRYLVPTFEQGKDYLFDIHHQLEALCPEILRPETSGENLIFRNPRWKDPAARSVLEMRGMKNPDAARGPRAHVIVCDEVREWEDLEHAVKDVLVWQFADMEKPLLILSTTPPDSMAHPYVKKYIPQAIGLGTYYIFPLEDSDDRFRLWYDEEPRRATGNKTLSPELREAIERECGGKETATYKREALCKLLSNPESLIVPEFAAVKSRIVMDIPWPDHFYAYCGLDFGWQDHNGVLYALFDFKRQQLFVMGEIWAQNCTTGQIAEAMHKAEERLFLATLLGPGQNVDRQGRAWRYRDLIRVGDHSMQQIADLAFDHDLGIMPADKWDRDAALANMRLAIQSEKILISPRCLHLIEQLEHGIWRKTRDGQRKEFERTDALGHCDLIAALLYLWRKVDPLANPVPTRDRLRSGQFIAPDEDEANEGHPLRIDWQRVD